MSLIGRLFGSSSDDSSASTSDALETEACPSCGKETDVLDFTEGQCDDCNADSEYSGSKYCCGAIYEDGEDTCMSCGESL